MIYSRERDYTVVAVLGALGFSVALIFGGVWFADWVTKYVGVPAGFACMLLAELGVLGLAALCLRG